MVKMVLSCRANVVFAVARCSRTQFVSALEFFDVRQDRKAARRDCTQFYPQDESYARRYLLIAEGRRKNNPDPYPPSQISLTEDRHRC